MAGDQGRLAFEDADPGSEASSSLAAEAPQRRRGRPRKWATEADRKHAYRQRLAVELAEPAELRRELRAERARSAALARTAEQRGRELDRTKRLLARALDDQEELEAAIEQLRTSRDYWQSRWRQADDELVAKENGAVVPDPSRWHVTCAGDELRD